MKTNLMKRLGLLTLAAGLIVSPLNAKAESDRTTCTMTIYASKHQGGNRAQATGECKGLVTGGFNATDKYFVAEGMYTGKVVNGQTEEIILANSKYIFADLTFYTVNDYT